MGVIPTFSYLNYASAFWQPMGMLINIFSSLCLIKLIDIYSLRQGNKW